MPVGKASSSTPPPHPTHPMTRPSCVCHATAKARRSAPSRLPPPSATEASRRVSRATTPSTASVAPKRSGSGKGCLVQRTTCILPRPGKPCSPGAMSDVQYFATYSMTKQFIRPSTLIPYLTALTSPHSVTIASCPLQSSHLPSPEEPSTVILLSRR